MDVKIALIVLSLTLLGVFFLASSSDITGQHSLSIPAGNPDTEDSTQAEPRGGLLGVTGGAAAIPKRDSSD